MAKPSGKARYEKIWQDSKGNLRDAWGRFLKSWQEIEGYKEDEDFQSSIKESDRQIQRGELKSLLSRNVCEIVFVRRRPERAPGRPEIRRMLCSNCMDVLNSENGIRSLNFHFPYTPRRIDEVKHNIVVVWDIIMQDYRNVSMENCHLRQTIPGDDTFWKYYNKVLLQMSSAQKQTFMDSIQN
jgi:hypothetical protein